MQNTVISFNMLVYLHLCHFWVGFNQLISPIMGYIFLFFAYLVIFLATAGRPYCVLNHSSTNLEVLPAGWWEHTLFLSLCKHQELWPLILSSGSLTTLGSFLTCMCWSVLDWILKRNLLKISKFLSLWALSSLVLCPENSSCLALPRLAAAILQLRQCAGLCLGSTLLWSGNSLKAESWIDYRGDLICFQSLEITVFLSFIAVCPIFLKK